MGDGLEVSDFEIKVGVLLSLILSIAAIVLLALYKKASSIEPMLDQDRETDDKTAAEPVTPIATSSQDFESIENPMRPLVEGCIIEYSDFFLKADSGGFIVTEAGDLSIEFFRDKDVEVVAELTLKERLENKDTQYVPTNHGPIHRQHFVVKGA